MSSSATTSAPTQTIEVIVDRQGQSTLVTRGFTAAACRNASRFLEQALGERTSEQLTAEFYQLGALQPEQVKQKG